MNNDPIHSLAVESSLSLTITKEGLQLTVALSIWPRS